MLIIKVMHSDARFPGSEDGPHSLFADVKSVHFPSDGKSCMRLWVMEPVKTALVPGFSENEVNVDITGPVYVMNEQGRTISTFHRPVMSNIGSVG